MKQFPLFRLILLIVFIFVSIKSVYAQIASPHLFQSQRSYNPATVVLRKNTSIAHLQEDGTGETKTVTETGGDTGEVEKYKLDRQSLFGVLLVDVWGLEIFYDLKDATEIDTENNSIRPLASNTIKKDSSQKYIALGLNAGQALYLGINITQIEETNETFKIINTDQMLGFGLTYRLFENLQFGLGSNFVQSEATKKVRNTWFEYYYGLSYYAIKSKSKAQLRIEFNSINSPEDGEKASEGNAANNHRFTEDSSTSVEIQYQAFKVLYQNRTHTLNPLSTRPSESKDTTKTTTIGIGYFFSFPSIFIEIFQHDAERTRGEFTTTIFSTMELSVGILF